MHVDAAGQPVQPGYYAQGQQATTVVLTQPTIAVVQQYRESPVHTRCPHCQAEVMTGTYYETGTFTWVICLILALVGYVPFNFINDQRVLRDWNLHLGHLSYTGPCRVRTF